MIKNNEKDKKLSDDLNVSFKIKCSLKTMIDIRFLFKIEIINDVSFNGFQEYKNADVKVNLNQNLDS
jgi:hypothetical protein